MPKNDSDKLVFVRITSITVDPFMKKFLITSGSLIVELDEAFDGFIGSARLWFNEITSTVENMCAPFPCVFDPGVLGGEIRQDRIHYEFVPPM